MIPSEGMIGPPSSVSDGEEAKVHPDLSIVTTEVVLLLTPSTLVPPVLPGSEAAVIFCAWDLK